MRTVPEAIGPTLPTACHSGLDTCYLMWYPNGQGPFTPHLHLAFPPAEMCIHEVIKSAGSWRGILGERYQGGRPLPCSRGRRGMLCLCRHQGRHWLRSSALHLHPTLPSCGNGTGLTHGAPMERARPHAGNHAGYIAPPSTPLSILTFGGTRRQVLARDGGMWHVGELEAGGEPQGGIVVMYAPSNGLSHTPPPEGNRSAVL